MSARVAIEAPAKLNLRLIVLGREASGYHSLETVFCAVELADRIEIARGTPGIRLEVTGDVDTGPGERNLAVQAAEAFFAASGELPGVSILLDKRIPAAAGLGGGSSDAAATLRALNALHGDPLLPDRLLQIGAALGSDVPFFLTPTPFALGWARGQRLLSLPPLPPRPVLVAHPGDPMPTAAAFARLAQLRGDRHAAPGAVVSHRALTSWEELAPLAVNDLEPPAFEKIPRLLEAKRALEQGGASISLLAGSGASIFGVFDRADRLADAERRLAGLRMSTWRTRTLERWPQPTPRD